MLRRVRTSMTAASTAAPSLLLLAFMASLGPFGDTEYTPSLPGIARSLDIPYGQAQLTMTVYLFGFAVSQLFYGPYSDRFGRRPAILFAVALFFAGSLICAFSNTLGLLLLGRFVQSLGACAGAVISNAAIRDAFPPADQTKVFLYVNAAFSLAPGIGPIAGSLIEHTFGWQANFVLLAVLAVLLFVALLFAFPETNRHKSRHATRPPYFVTNYLRLLHHPAYVYYIILVGLSIGLIYCSLVEAPHLVMVELGFPAKTFALVAVCIVSGFMLGTGSCVLLQRYLHDPQLIVVGLVIMLAGSMAIGYFASERWITLPNMLASIAVIYIGLAFVVPVATARALEPFTENAGAASSMLGCISMGLASASTLFISLLPKTPPQAAPDNMFVTFSLLIGLSLIATLVANLLFPAKL